MPAFEAAQVRERTPALLYSALLGDYVGQALLVTFCIPVHSVLALAKQALRLVELQIGR